jgi:hypothetical protein
MLKSLKYHWYVLKHRWFVFLAGLTVGASLWRIITHDLSKYLPSEWYAYLEYFYGEKTEKAKEDFDKAWLLHQRRNKHHWQYWLLNKDDGSVVPLEMPQEYVKEMVADWVGAGRAITGKTEVFAWYSKNKHNIVLHDKTREAVEDLLYKHYYWT